MIAKFFKDIIFREEDVLHHQVLLPGDKLDMVYSPDECVEVFIVRVGEEIKIQEGEK